MPYEAWFHKHQVLKQSCLCIELFHLKSNDLSFSHFHLIHFIWIGRRLDDRGWENVHIGDGKGRSPYDTVLTAIRALHLFSSFVRNRRLPNTIKGWQRTANSINVDFKLFPQFLESQLGQLFAALIRRKRRKGGSKTNETISKIQSISERWNHLV